MPFAVLFGATVLPCIALLGAPVQGADEGLLLVHAEQVRSGLIPLKDFFTFYGSGSYRILLLFGPNGGLDLQGERTLGMIYRLGIIFAIALVGGRFSRRAGFLSALATAAAFSFQVPVAYAWLGATSLVLCGISVASCRSSSLRALAIASFLVSLATFWRPEAGAFIVTLIPFMKSVRQARALTCGALLGLAPLAIESLSVGPGLIVATIAGRMAKNFQVADELIEPSVVVCVCVAGALSIGLFLSSFASTQDSSTAVARALGLTGLVALPQALQRTDIEHLTYIFPLSIAPGVAFLSAVALRRRIAWTLSTATVLAFIGIVIALAGTAGLTSQARPLSRDGRTLTLPPQQLAPVASVLDYVTAKVPQGGKVFVGAQDMSLPAIANISLYYLMPKHPPTFYFTELAPGYSESHGSRLLSDLSRSDALILEDLSLQAKFAWPHIQPGSQAANRVVEHDFCRGPQFGVYRVYLRQGRC